MDKALFIIKCFGAAWNKLPWSMQEHILKVHHWVDRSPNRMNLSPKDLGFDEETECETNCEFWRPLSMAGIETNNGWTCINSVEDLPKEKMLCRVANRQNPTMFLTTVFDPEDSIQSRRQQVRSFSHYRNIEKPPVY